MKGLRYIAPVGGTGYAVAARRYLLGLARAGALVTFTPLVPGRWRGMWDRPFEGRSIGDVELDLLVNRDIDYDTVIVHQVPEFFPIFRELEPDRRLVGYTTWETTVLPPSWPKLLAVPDQLLVPCEWNREVFSAGGVDTPMAVIPHTAPGREPPERAWAAGLGIPADAFAFYTIGRWTARKALDATLRAYLNAFTADDPVVFVVKTTRRDFTRTTRPWDRLTRRLPRETRAAVRQLTRMYPRPPRIVLLDEPLPAAAIDGLHARGDCFVSLAAAEGWGLGAFDAAAWGRPVVITGFGGHLDYLDGPEAMLVRHELVRVDTREGENYFGDQRWARADVAHATALLRRVFEAPTAARAAAAAIRERLHARFNEAAVTERLLTALGSAGSSAPAD